MDEMVATEFGISSGQESVRLMFRDDLGQEFVVRIHPDNIPQLSEVLLAEIEPTKQGDIGDLQLSRDFSILGFRVHKKPDGGCVLLVKIEIEEPLRVLELPLDFSPRDLETLFPMIVGTNDKPTH